MTKRYREEIQEVELAPRLGVARAGAATSNHTTEGDAEFDIGRSAPVRFRWRGRRYHVTSVLGHWYEDAGWWRRTDGVPERIERTDLWRVEAGGGRQEECPEAVYGVYELVRRGDVWRLDRVWD